MIIELNGQICAIFKVVAPGVLYSTAMPANTAKLTSIVEGYLEACAAFAHPVGRRQSDPLMRLSPFFSTRLARRSDRKIVCVPELADLGAGHPDFGLYAANQVQRGRPRQGQIPGCGVVEVKPAFVHAE